MRAFRSYAGTFLVTFDTTNGYKRPSWATKSHGTHTRAMLYCLMASQEALHSGKVLVALVAVKL